MAHLGPVGPRWATCWPHEPCYQGLCPPIADRYSAILSRYYQGTLYMLYTLREEMLKYTPVDIISLNLKNASYPYKSLRATIPDVPLNTYDETPILCPFRICVGAVRVMAWGLQGNRPSASQDRHSPMAGMEEMGQPTPENITTLAGFCRHGYGMLWHPIVKFFTDWFWYIHRPKCLFTRLLFSFSVLISPANCTVPPLTAPPPFQIFSNWYDSSSQ